MDSWLGSGKLQDLLKVRSSIMPSTRRRCLKSELESNHTVAAIVGDPQCLDSRVIVRMAKHIRIIDEPMDELDGGKNRVTLVWKKLKDCAMLAANDYTVVHKCDRRRRIVAANRR